MNTNHSSQSTGDSSAAKGFAANGTRWVLRTTTDGHYFNLHDTAGMSMAHNKRVAIAICALQLRLMVGIGVMDTATTAQAFGSNPPDVLANGDQRQTYRLRQQ